MDTIRKQHLRFRSASPAVLAFTLLVGAPAWAQTLPPQEAPSSTKADAPNPSGVSDEAEIIVTGTRASLQSAAARKKNAGTVVDSIVAEDIASFPDKNVGEALSRITGVQLSREFGEGTAVSIRGVQPELNRVQINGVSQQSALGGRSGDFRELQVELVKSIDVFKGYTVDIPEGGIGGTVSIETRRPLELLKPIFAVKAEGQYLDLTETFKPRLNLTAGRADLLGGRLGVIVNVTHSQVDTRSDFAANTNWQRIADFDRSAEKTVADPAYANFNTYESCGGTTGATPAAATANRLACETQFFDWAPLFPRYRNLNRQDNRTTADFQAQFAFTDNFSVFGQAQVNSRIQTLQDTNYSVDLGNFNRFNLDAALAANAAGGASRPRVQAGTSTVDNHVVTSALTARNGVNIGTALTPNFNGANSNVGVQRRDFDYNQTTQYYQAGFKWELDRLSMTGFAGYATGNTINNTNLVAISTGVAGVTVDRTNDLGIPVFQFPGNFDPANPADYATIRSGANGQPLVQAGPSVQYRPQDVGSQEKELRLDVDYRLDFGPITTIEYGGQYREAGYYNYLGGGARLLQSAVTAVPAAGIVGRPAIFQQTANVSLNTVIGPVPAAGPAPNTVYLTQAQYQQFVANNVGVNGGAPLFTGLRNAPAGAPERLAEPIFNYGGLSQYYNLTNFNQNLVREADGLPQIPNYLINENIVAGYFKVNFEQEIFGMRLTGNAGIRYTWTEDISESSNTRRETRIRPGTGVNGIPGVVETVTLSVQSAAFRNSYFDWLPAVNLNLEMVPNLFLRATYAQNLARPNVTDLSPAVNCLFDFVNVSVTGEQVCSAGNPELEPYRADQYDLNLAWYPNADTVVSLGYYYKDLISFVLPRQVRNGVDLFNDGVLFTVSQPINGFGAKLDGFEASAQTVFSFLPAPFDGLGASANFTYARALNSALTNQATGEPLNGFPGLSTYTYNGRIFYDKDWLNASLTYNRRSDWLVEAANANFGNNPIFRSGETFIDARIQFRLTEDYSIFVEGLNLGKEFSLTYIDEARPIEYNYPGQRIFVGAQFKL